MPQKLHHGRCRASQPKSPPPAANQLSRYQLLLLVSLSLPCYSRAADHQQQLDLVQLCQSLHTKAKADSTATTSRQSVNTAAKQLQAGDIKLVPHNIFDDNNPDNFWLHEFANWLHIVTKPSVIKRELSIASEQQLTTADLAEAERILRSKSYLRDAKVRAASECRPDGRTDILVETWDNWSLLPTVGFGRSSGSNQYSFGFKEENLLGYGVRASVKYQSDYLRSGYELKVSAPLPLTEHSYLHTELQNNDDGSRQRLSFDQPFYQDTTARMWFGDWLQDKHAAQIYQNGQLQSRFQSEQQAIDIATGWLWHADSSEVWRVKLGIAKDRLRFSELTNDGLLLDPLQLVPADREISYAWLGLDYQQQQFQVLSDVFLINHPEDINLGWHHQLKVGVSSSGNQTGMVIDSRSNAGFGDSAHLSLLEMALVGNYHVQWGNQTKLKLQWDDFYRLDQQFTLYSKLQYDWQSRSFADQPLTLGGDSGLRGFPVQYQHGKQRLFSTVELRWYPQWQIYQILDVGWVAFVDAGRASGQAQYQVQPLRAAPTNIQLPQADLANLSSGWIGSVGLGLRLFSSRSSNNNVIHLDLSKPLGQTPLVNSWEVSLKVEQRF